MDYNSFYDILAAMTSGISLDQEALLDALMLTNCNVFNIDVIALFAKTFEPWSGSCRPEIVRTQYHPGIGGRALMPKLRPLPQPRKITEADRMRHVWHLMCQEIALRGGTVTTKKYAAVMRFSCLPNSALPGWLATEFCIPHQTSDNEFEFILFQ